MNLKHFLENIRKFRESKSISQEFVAHHLGLTQSAYAKLENNQNKITFEKILLISDILEIDILHFLIGETKLSKEIDFKNLVFYISRLQNENDELKKKLINLQSKYISKLEE